MFNQFLKHMSLEAQTALKKWELFLLELLNS